MYAARSPTHAASAKPSVVAVTSRAPNAKGWYSAPVTGTLTVKGVKTVAQCTEGVAFTDANGKLAGSKYKRYITYPAASCKVSDSVSKSGVKDLSIKVVVGKTSVTKHLLLRLDSAAPSISITAPQAPVAAQSLKLLGTVADAYSGPDAVTLHFSDPGGAQASFNVRAVCGGCGKFHECGSSCGYATQWSYEGSPPPGAWTVSAAATDLAGNTTISDPVNIIVV